MNIIPAIYIQSGQSVSWYKGYENAQKKVYVNSPPLKTARYFSQLGADTIQIIDLDKSVNQNNDNLETILKIAQEIPAHIQVAGGITNLDYIDRLVQHKIRRVIIGYSGHTIIHKAIERFGKNAIIAGIKAKKNLLESQALLTNRKIEVLDYARQIENIGVETIIYKDLESEGTNFPHYDEVDRLLSICKAKIYLSGGISDYVQMDTLKKISLHGVIISKAFIERKLSLKRCIEKYH